MCDFVIQFYTINQKNPLSRYVKFNWPFKREEGVGRLWSFLEPSYLLVQQPL